MAFAILKQFIRAVVEKRKSLFSRTVKDNSLWSSKLKFRYHKSHISPEKLVSQKRDVNFLFEMKLLVLCLSFLYTLRSTSNPLSFSRKEWIYNHYPLSRMSNNIEYF